MRWCHFRRQLESNVLLCKTPDIAFVHLGGNDVTSGSLTAVRNTIKREINYLRAAIPDSLIVWVDILQRRNWRSTNYSIQEIERIRTRINRFGKQQVARHSKFDFLTLDIDSSTEGFFRNDGVHLSKVGLEFYLYEMREMILKHI